MASRSPPGGKGAGGAGNGSAPPRSPGVARVRAARDKARKASITIAPVLDDAPASVVIMPGVMMPPGFEMWTNGLYRTPQGDRDKPWKVAGRFQVLAESRPEGNDQWGLLLQWLDRDARTHRWIMPRRVLVGEAIEVRSRFADCGLDVSGTQGARQALVDFLLGVKVEARVRTVQRTGWHGLAGDHPIFVLPGQAIGGEADGQAAEVVQLDLDPPPAIYGARGTLDGWRDQVAALCVGNSRLIFGVSCAFAPILLPLIGDEGGGVNLRGESSKGKTTIVDAAASVWGPPSKTGPGAFVRQWRTTGNALESTAAGHNHALLPMDEMGQADPKELGETLYMLANGSGKDRARAGGGNRVATTWLTLVLSSSEESAASMAAQAGRRIKAGQEVRLLDIPAVVPGGYGCFDELHGRAEGATFARAIRASVIDHHGTAAPAFLAWVTARLREDRDLAGNVIEDACRSWLARFGHTAADGQVARAARRMALIAVAGELATSAGVTGWQDGEAFAAVGQVFKDWLIERGGTGSREEHHLFAAVRKFLGVNGNSRFEVFRGDGRNVELEAGRPVINRAGWRWQETVEMPTEMPGDEDDALVIKMVKTPVWVHGMVPEVFRAEILAAVGGEMREALSSLVRAGMIHTEKTGGKTRHMLRKSIHGVGRQSLIIFNPAAFAAHEPD